MSNFLLLPTEAVCTCLIQSLDLANFHSISARSYNGLMICETRGIRYVRDGIKFTFFYVSYSFGMDWQ